MEPLARLFGSVARLKLIRLFLANLTESFSLVDIVQRAKVTKTLAHKELSTLRAAGLVSRKRGKEARYSANPKFEYLAAFESFTRATSAVRVPSLLAVLRKAGSLRLVLLSGLFTGAVEAPADLLIVGENLSDAMLARAVREVEAELGREIRYAAFDVEEFRYRLGIYDRLIRDILDYPHRVLLDKIGL